jgi:hypothetical protein
MEDHGPKEKKSNAIKQYNYLQLRLVRTSATILSNDHNNDFKSLTSALGNLQGPAALPRGKIAY